MKKQIAKTMIGAMIISTAFSITSFAATAKGWQFTDNQWHYVDSYGDYKTDDWAKSGDYYYYLDSEGNLATDQVVDDGTNLYYVDESGRMATNQWKKLTREEDDENEARWYYFQSSGKAVKSTSDSMKITTVGGKKYAFDSDGKMLYGFVNEGQMLDDDADVTTAQYYFGEAEDGSMKTGWVQTDDIDNDEYSDYDTLWFYFNPTTGKKVTSSSKTIDGKKYTFDDNGVMISGWVTTTASGSTAASTKYYSEANDGHLQKNTWIHAIPGEDVDSDDYNDGTYRWFYTDNSGSVYKDTTKRINNKWYVFDSVGRMTAGLVVLNQDSTTGAQISTTLDAEEITSDDIISGNYGAALRYFSGDEEKDGSMKTGTVSIELSDGTATFVFGTTGQAYNGLKNKKIYVSGLLLKADTEYKYEVVTNPVDSQKYVIGTTGAIVADGKYVKDADGNYYAVYDGTIAYISGDNASKAASQFAKTGDVGTYASSVTVVIK